MFFTVLTLIFCKPFFWVALKSTLHPVYWIINAVLFSGVTLLHKERRILSVLWPIVAKSQRSLAHGGGRDDGVAGREL
jgi:hypothetical protein